MKKYKFIMLAVLSLFFIVSCNGGKKSGQETKEEEVLPDNIVELRADQIKLADVEMGSVEVRSLSGTFKANGTVAVAPQSLATVCMPMGGFVKKTSLMPGQRVRKGQTLAIIENQEFVDIQQNYLEAKNKLEYAGAEYKRHSELYKDDVYSQKNVQQVTVEYKNLKTQVSALEQKLALIGINPRRLRANNISRFVALTSPISGYVKTVNVNMGKFVAPSDVLFEIVNSNELFLELSLFEKNADKVADGQRIKFFINDETETHNAIVYHTGKAINTDKTYKVYARISGFCRNVLPGMYVNAVVQGISHKTTVLPSDAVVSFDDKDYIFVFNRDKREKGKSVTEYRMIEVHKGITDGGYTEIILPGDFSVKTTSVVVKGAYNLLSAKKNAGEMSC